ncbi:glycosyltransferase family 4 protein [Candidatus Parcubacteria bacterium]|nr:MAG: glycosyltransferase family 4 protein [Candidatus Parcubacteria bacterium]
MRVLYIGHTYIVTVNRQKLRELARFDDIELMLVVPKKWPDYLKTQYVQPEDNPSFAFYPTATLFHGSETLYIYFPNLGLYVRRFQPDIIHVEQGPYALAYTQAIINKKLFAPQAKCLFFTWWNLPYTLKPYWRAVEKFNLRHTDYAITGNNDARQILRMRGFNGPVKVLPQLGVDTNLFRRLDVTGLKQTLGLTGFTVGFVGRLVPEKGLVTLVEAFAQLPPDCHLLLVGRGELKSHLLAMAANLGLADRLHLVDTVPHTDVPLYLNCMDIMVLPSLTTPTWAEQFGHVLIEAMACQTPVIGSSSAEIPNVIGEAGLIFAEGNVKDLAAKLRQLYDNPQLRVELVQRGLRRVQDNFTDRRLAKEIYQIYRELLTG